MTFVPVKPGGWAVEELLTSAQMNELQDQMTKAIDGFDGGTYPLNSPLTLNGTVTIDDLIAVLAAVADLTVTDLTVTGDTVLKTLNVSGESNFIGTTFSDTFKTYIGKFRESTSGLGFSKLPRMEEEGVGTGQPTEIFASHAWGAIRSSATTHEDNQEGYRFLACMDRVNGELFVSFDGGFTGASTGYNQGGTTAASLPMDCGSKGNGEILTTLTTTSGMVALGDITNMEADTTVGPSINVATFSGAVTAMDNVKIKSVRTNSGNTAHFWYVVGTEDGGGNELSMMASQDPFNAGSPDFVGSVVDSVTDAPTGLSEGMMSNGDFGVVLTTGTGNYYFSSEGAAFTKVDLTSVIPSISGDTFKYAFYIQELDRWTFIPESIASPRAIVTVAASNLGSTTESDYTVYNIDSEFGDGREGNNQSFSVLLLGDDIAVVGRWVFALSSGNGAGDIDTIAASPDGGITWFQHRILVKRSNSTLAFLTSLCPYDGKCLVAASSRAGVSGGAVGTYIYASERVVQNDSAFWRGVLP